MHFTTVTLSTLLASAAASAIPTVHSRAGFEKRSEREWDAAGNLKLVFSPETVKIGGLSIDDIMSEMGHACQSEGQCDTTDIEKEAQLMSASNVLDIKVTIGPHGAYPTWIRNGLLDTMGAAIRSVAQCTPGTYTNTCPGVTAMAYCPRKKTQFVNCEVPRFWGVNYQSENAVDSAPPFVSLDLEMELVDNPVCEKAFETLGTVAGAINGVAGGFFTLLSMACK